MQVETNGSLVESSRKRTVFVKICFIIFSVILWIYFNKFNILKLFIFLYYSVPYIRIILNIIIDFEIRNETPHGKKPLEKVQDRMI